MADAPVDLTREEIEARERMVAEDLANRKPVDRKAESLPEEVPEPFRSTDR